MSFFGKEIKLHIFTLRQFVFVLIQNFISSMLRDFMGGQEKALQQTKNNKRTPQTISISRQDMKDPRVNRT